MEAASLSSLKIPTICCLVMHLLQLIFLRRFIVDGKVNNKYKFVWVLHIFVYPYVLYAAVKNHLAQTAHKEPLESRTVWISLDLMLTFGIGCYYCVYNYLQ